MSYQVPFSSSPQVPSTPGSIHRNRNLLSTPASDLASNPSTTPAGPPPSSVASFTPADPPPSSRFGSSQLGSGKSLFKKKQSAALNSGPRVNANPFSKKINEDKLARYLDKTGHVDFGSSNGYSAATRFDRSSASKANGSGKYAYEEGSEDLDAASESEGSEEEAYQAAMELDARVEHGLSKDRTVDLGSSFMGDTPRGVKRSRGGAKLPVTSSRNPKKQSKPRTDSTLSGVAKNLATNLGVAGLKESDSVILGTEEIIQADLHGLSPLRDSPERNTTPILRKVSESLSRFWRFSRDQYEVDNEPEADVIIGVGPNEDEPSLHKATFLASLLLQLRHPPEARGKQALAVARLSQSSTASRPYPQNPGPSNPTALPKVLIDWLEYYHNPYYTAVVDVMRYEPNPTAHHNFWDVVSSLLLRGKLADVVLLLKRAKFQYARTARDDGLGSGGYHNAQIKNIDRAVSRAIQILERCPNLQDEDWNVTNNEWTIFRKHIHQAVDDLTIFAEGRDRDSDPTESTLEASNFGLRKTTTDFSQTSRKAESRVPWQIYQNLKALYAITLGGQVEIMAQAQDWVEATIGLTIWWDGDDDEPVPVGSLAMTRRSLRQSHSGNVRLVDVKPAVAYLRRLADAFALVTDPSDNDSFQINSMNPVEVGLACVFESEVEGVISLLRAWSLSVASAVAEVAGLGGWFVRSGGVNLMGFSTNEIQLEPELDLTMDSILVDYAAITSERDKFQGKPKGIIVEGWELSIALLKRLHDQKLAKELAGQLLDNLPVQSDERVGKILETCEKFKLSEEARRITEAYADSIAENTDDYGTALTFYARARSSSKIKGILDLLISMSLIDSLAYPSLSKLDPNLHALIFNPEDSLTQLKEGDAKAAEILHHHLSGYAALRKFYDLRDEDVRPGHRQRSNLRPMARKRAAATALLAVINSAADNIHGGLFDPDRCAVVQVDGLMALLGEAMVFVNQSQSSLPLPQCFALLKAIEDLQTVTQRVYSKCEDCFRSTLAAFWGRGALASPRDLLKKTMSSMTSAGTFSLVGSSMLDSESNGGSKALVKTEEEEKRGWDWRKGLPKDSTGEDMLRILRLGLAKDIAKHWITGAGA